MEQDSLYSHFHYSTKSPTIHNGAHPNYSCLSHFQPLDNSAGAKLVGQFDIRHAWITTAIECASPMRSASFVEQSLPDRILGAAQCDVGSAHTSSI
jgi:hypothetical protein